VQYPLLALPGRQRRRGVVAGRDERWPPARRTGALQQTPGGRRLEHVPHGEFGAEHRTDPGDEAAGQQGVPAEREEVVVHRDGVGPEHLGEQTAQQFLSRGDGG